MQQWLQKINFHIVFFLAVFLIILMVIVRLVIWDNSGTTIEFDPNATVPNETGDSFIPFLPEEGYTDDGFNDIAFFGNAPFADDAGTEQNLVELIGAKTGGRVYNFAFEDSYLSTESQVLSYENRDLLSLYWLTTIFAVDNDVIVDNALQANMTLSQEELATLSLLMNLDFSTIDIIAIMYDSSDYLAVRGMYNNDDDQNITHFAGALNASIQLIQQTYPDIHIIVMSPTYSYALAEDGSYLDSFRTAYGEEGAFPSYIQYQSNVCYSTYTTFVDNFYGGVTYEEAEQYLTDYKNLNQAGRELIANRFMEAYEHYTFYKKEALNTETSE